MDNIILNLPSESREDAIRRAGRLLVDGGYVEERYVEGMLARDNSFSTGIGNLIAIPHGEKEYKSHIKTAGMCVLTYPQGIEWHGSTVKIVIGIAARGDEHLDIIGNIVDNIEDEDDAEAFLQIADKQGVLEVICGQGAA